MNLSHYNSLEYILLCWQVNMLEISSEALLADKTYKLWWSEGRGEANIVGLT